MKYRYSLDSNALIQAWMMWYTDALHPGFWEGLVELGRAGRLLVSEEVFSDLSANGTRTEDPIFQWCRQIRNSILAPSDKIVQKEVSRLVNAYSGFGGTNIPGEKNYSDPFVVAVASVSNAIVVTHEGHNSKGLRGMPIQHHKIPDVCRSESIAWTQVYGIIQREGWIFDRRSGR